MRQQFVRLGIFGFIVMLCISISNAQTERLNIVASHSILGDVIANVAGDVADVQTMMPRGADPHSFQLVPRDLVTLADADVVFINGAFFEEGLLETIENAGTELHIVTVSVCVPILASTDHDHEEEHPAGSSTDNTIFAETCIRHQAEVDAMQPVASTVETLGRLYTINCEEEPCDPHVWMEPRNVLLWTLLIRDTLIELDPQNAETYRANAQVYLQEVSALISDFVSPMVESLAPARRIMITNHDSFAYFATYYGFEVIGTVIPTASTLAEPSTADLVAMIELIGQHEVAAIFAETTMNDALIQQISAETGIPVLTLYSGSLSEIGEPANTYLDFIRYNVTTIVEALNAK